MRSIGWVLAGVYIGSVVLANVLTTRYGLVPVFPGLVATAGTFAVGGAIMMRDFLQDAIGRIGVLAAIALGAGLSFLLAAPRIALASGVTFLLAESLEFAVYTPMRRRYRWGGGEWAGTVAGANLAGALADTVLFLVLAGFALTGPVVAGQLVGKAYITALAVSAGVVIRRAVPDATIETS